MHHARLAILALSIGIGFVASAQPPLERAPGQYSRGQGSLPPKLLDMSRSGREGLSLEWFWLNVRSEFSGRVETGANRPI